MIGLQKKVLTMKKDVWGRWDRLEPCMGQMVWPGHVKISAYELLSPALWVTLGCRVFLSEISAKQGKNNFGTSYTVEMDTCEGHRGGCDSANLRVCHWLHLQWRTAETVVIQSCATDM